MAETLISATVLLLLLAGSFPASLSCGDHHCPHHPPKQRCPSPKCPPPRRHPPPGRLPPGTTPTRPPSPPSGWLPPVLPPSPPYQRPSPVPYLPPPTTPVPSPPAATGTCPIDALKLGLCVDVLSGLVHVGIGAGARDVCCPLLQGLASLDAALCLCTTIRGRLLNLDLLLPIALSLLLDCGKYVPADYKCPPLP